MMFPSRKVRTNCEGVDLHAVNIPDPSALALFEEQTGLG